MTPRQAQLIELMHREVKPALGCTEPIAVALAVAKAVELLIGQDSCCDDDGKAWRLDADFHIEVAVSGNILKNGMGVGIPGTGMVGLPVAAALGAVCGQSRYGLEVLGDLGPDAVARAKELVAARKVTIGLADTERKLYVRATVRVEPHQACAVIEDDHDRIVETALDGHLIFSCRSEAGPGTEEKAVRDYGLTVREIVDFAETADYQDIQFILQDRELNFALAEEGLRGDYGLRVGQTIRANQEEIFGDNFMSYAMGITAAASDARMAGCTLPAMSNSGSGNQGITVSMPIIAYALRHGIDDERLARALTLSNLIAIHIKGHLGKLSALCGCVVASTGSSCGIVYLKGGGYEAICAAIKNMIGNITGMVCDGAKVGCAMKVASGVSSAIQSAILALNGICVSENDGIIERDIEKTIANLGAVGSVGMQSTDELILQIMTCK